MCAPMPANSSVAKMASSPTATTAIPTWLTARDRIFARCCGLAIQVRCASSSAGARATFSANAEVARSILRTRASVSAGSFVAVASRLNDVARSRAISASRGFHVSAGRPAPSRSALASANRRCSSSLGSETGSSASPVLGPCAAFRPACGEHARSKTSRKTYTRWIVPLVSQARRPMRTMFAMHAPRWCAAGLPGSSSATSAFRRPSEANCSEADTELRSVERRADVEVEHA